MAGYYGERSQGIDERDVNSERLRKSVGVEQGVKLKFNDFQQTTQEHVWPQLNKEDLITTARKTWDERRGERGVRLVGLHVTLLDPQLERQLVLGL